MDSIKINIGLPCTNTYQQVGSGRFVTLGDLVGDDLRLEENVGLKKQTFLKREYSLDLDRFMGKNKAHEESEILTFSREASKQRLDVNY